MNMEKLKDYEREHPHTKHVYLTIKILASTTSLNLYLLNILHIMYVNTSALYWSGFSREQ